MCIGRTDCLVRSPGMSKCFACDASIVVQGHLSSLQLAVFACTHAEWSNITCCLQIGRRFSTALLTHHTTVLARQDLEKYHRALDSALMRYHTLKIKEINSIIEELWQSTYKGRDIDSLRISYANLILHNVPPNTPIDRTQCPPAWTTPQCNKGCRFKSLW